MQPFQYLSFAQEVIFGTGSLGQLRPAVERAGWQRVMLCTSRSQVANGRAEALRAALGDCLVAVFDQVQPHVQEAQVDEAVALAKEHEVQALIGMGGGSPIGMAKAAAHALDPGAAVIAIPTTYAGSEMTAVFGVTRMLDGHPRKVTVSDARIAPRLVIYDPALTLDLPPDLTASTGINALAHCIEALYSITRHPLSTQAAQEGLRRMARALPLCFVGGGGTGGTGSSGSSGDIEARSEMMLGAHLAGFSLASVKMGLHHGLCHILGGSFGVPHGVANSIVLPHAVRYNAAGPGAPQLVKAAEAMGIITPVVNGQSRSTAEVNDELVERLFALTAQLRLPQRLREASIQLEDLPAIARMAAESRTVQNNPRAVSVEEMEELLKEMW